ncbi:MAG: NADH dehydrogenase ubiquinone Fe-S protein 4 [Holosporaceae bacterium]
MHDVLILRPTKSAMQSARLGKEVWELHFCIPPKGNLDPRMHWVTQKDARQAVKLTFQNVADAIAYAKKHDLSYHVQETDPAAPLAPHSYEEHLLKPHMRS